MPLYITPQLQLSERYANNSFHASNFPAEDYITYLSASLGLEYQFNKGHLNANVSLQSTYSASANNLTNQLNLNQFGDLNYVYQLERGVIKLNGAVISTPFGDSVPQSNEGLLTPNSNFFQEKGEILGNYLVTRQTTLSMDYNYINNEYSSAHYVNSETHQISSSLAYQLKSSDQIALIGGVDLFKYKPGATMKAATGIIQLNHQMGESASLQVGAGAGITTGRHVDSLANLNYTRNFESGSVQTSFNRDFGSGGGLAGSSVINQGVNINLSKTLLRALSGSISGNYGTSDTIIPGANYHTELWNATSSLTYILSKLLSSSLSLAHYEQRTTSTFTDNTYSNQIWIFLSSSFSPWRPF